MKETLVLFPSPGKGHLLPILELGKLFLNQNFSISIILPNSAQNHKTLIKNFSSLNISFHFLPSISLPTNKSPHQESHAFDLLRLSNPFLLSLLSSLSQSSSLRALILDFFCTSAIDVAAQLGIPSYVFFTSGAASLAAFLHLPCLHGKISKSFKEIGDFPIVFPGVTPIPACDMPVPLMDRDDEAYKGFLGHAARMLDADGIIANTFLQLEPRPLQAIAEGLAVPNKKTPAVYCIGPLITTQAEPRHECLNWLDKQPKQSVIFLCFGSLGSFSSNQLFSIAIGLERSNQRFLWVIRIPPEADLQLLLPKGFLERTGERGFVVKSWAPQVEVLRHSAVGGFVMHCGWNSVLEAIVAGVAMVAWPLYAEQRMNKVVLVEMGLVVEMKGDEIGFVEAEEVEEKVRGLVEAEWGRELRKRIEVVKLAAEAALAESGSSTAAFNQLVDMWKTGR